MGFEQPQFDAEDTEKKEASREEPEQSNVIEGPWPMPERETVPPAENVREEESALQGETEQSNVIEGPWPKPESEPKPAERAPERLPNEPEAERAAEIERVREELTELYDSQEKKEEAPEPGEKEKDEDEKERRRFSETFEQYKRCEACGGKGRRWFFFPCPVCKGFGSVVASSSHREGYHESVKDAPPRQPAEGGEDAGQKARQ